MESEAAAARGGLLQKLPFGATVAWPTERDRTCLRPTQGPRLLAADLRDRAGAPLRGRPLPLRTSSSGLGKAPRTRCSAEESGRTAQHRWVTVCVHSVCPCGRVRKEASGRKGTSRLLVRRCGQGNFR